MRYTGLVPLGAMIGLSLAHAGTQPPGQVKDSTMSLPGLHGPARIVRDVDGMPHVYAFNEHDALYLQGWLQAQDRLFQIDVLRRQASGTLAELARFGRAEQRHRVAHDRPAPAPQSARWPRYRRPRGPASRPTRTA